MVCVYRTLFTELLYTCTKFLFAFPTLKFKKIHMNMALKFRRNLFFLFSTKTNFCKLSRAGILVSKARFFAL